MAKPKQAAKYHATMHLFVECYVPIHAESMEEAIEKAKAIDAAELWDGDVDVEDTWDYDIAVQAVNGPGITRTVGEKKKVK